MRMFASAPSVPVWQVTGMFIQMASQSALQHDDVGERLIESFSEAGLPEPNLFGETLVGGGIDSPFYAWVAETLQSLLPQLARIGIPFGELVGIETLEGRLREAVVAARSQIVGPGKSAHGPRPDHSWNRSTVPKAKERSLETIAGR